MNMKKIPIIGAIPPLKHNLWGAINFGHHTKYVKYEWFWHSDVYHLSSYRNFHYIDKTVMGT